MSVVAARPHPARAITLSALAALLITLFALVSPVSADPPGNNGTVKIDGVPFDDHPNNEPHPGCVFQVDFYGYDQGALFASVTFEHWNPTGDGHGDVLLHEEGIFIGEDSNAGGGSQAGLDASRTYDLSAALAGMEPHPQQGYHIKLTVHADGSQGSDVKHKVFWVECAGSPPGGEQGQALIEKVDQTGAGRAGAVFTLTGVTDPSFSATATTSATGSAGFTALVEGQYSLAETTPPTGCIGFAGSITITVDAEGDVSVGTLPAGVTFVSGTIRVVNSCGGQTGGQTGQLPLLKVDQNGAGRGGAIFTLTGVTNPSFNATATTSASGSATFGLLAAGQYSLAETTPPTGCTGFAGSITITVAATGAVSVGTLPAGVTFAGGTLRVVNNCGGGTSGGTPSGSGTLGGNPPTGAGALPNTSVGPTAGDRGPAAALTLLVIVSSLTALVGARLAESRARR